MKLTVDKQDKLGGGGTVCVVSQSLTTFSPLCNGCETEQQSGWGLCYRVSVNLGGY